MQWDLYIRIWVNLIHPNIHQVKKSVKSLISENNS